SGNQPIKGDTAELSFDETTNALAVGGVALKYTAPSASLLVTNTGFLQLGGNNTPTMDVYDVGVFPSATGKQLGNYFQTWGQVWGDSFMLKSATPATRVLSYRTDANRRWEEGVDGTAESGANAGSNYILARYNDAGALIDFPMAASRATGVVNFSQTPTVAGVPLGGAVTVGTTPPASPVNGQQWFYTDGVSGGGQMFVYYNDGNTSQWVPVSPAAAVASPGADPGCKTTFMPTDVILSQVGMGSALCDTGLIGAAGQKWRISVVATLYCNA